MASGSRQPRESERAKCRRGKERVANSHPPICPVRSKDRTGLFVFIPRQFLVPRLSLAAADVSRLIFFGQKIPDPTCGRVAQIKKGPNRSKVRKESTTEFEHYCKFGRCCGRDVRPPRFGQHALASAAGVHGLSRRTPGAEFSRRTTAATTNEPNVSSLATRRTGGRGRTLSRQWHRSGFGKNLADGIHFSNISITLTLPLKIYGTHL